MRRTPVGNGPVGSHQDQRFDVGVAKGHVRIKQPKAVRTLRISGAYVTIAEIAPAESCEHAVAERNLSLAPLPQCLRRWRVTQSLCHGKHCTAVQTAHAVPISVEIGYGTRHGP